MNDILTQLHTVQSNLLSNQAQQNTKMTAVAVSADEANQYLTVAQNLLNAMYAGDAETIEFLKTQEATRLKQTQFNNYFSQKLNYNVAIMKILVLTSVLIMICIVLYTRNLMPKFLYVSLVALIVSIAVIVVITMLVSEYRRTTTDFNKFWWFFNPNTALK
jgi:hypothetical protein